MCRIHCRKDARTSFLPELLKDTHHEFSSTRIKAGKGFVSHDNLAVPHQSSTEINPYLFSNTQLARRVTEPVRQPELAQQCEGIRIE